MSGFYNEILLKLGLPEETVGAKITVIDLKGVHIEGHGGIRGYSPEEITVKFKKKTLHIRGKELNVVAISKDEMYIKGRVCSCEVADE